MMEAGPWSIVHRLPHHPPQHVLDHPVPEGPVMDARLFFISVVKRQPLDRVAEAEVVGVEEIVNSPASSCRGAFLIRGAPPVHYTNN